MSSVQIGSPPTTSLGSGIAQGNEINPSSTGRFGSSSSSGETGNSSSTNNGDNISLTPGQAIGGAVGIAGAAAGLGIGGTWLIKRNAAPPSILQTSYQTRHKITGFGAADGKTLYEAVTHFPGMGPTALEDPLALVGPRYHPAQSGPNCAVDAFNMLVNGDKDLLANNSDFEAVKRGYGQSGLVENSALASKNHALPKTVTNPADFPQIHRKLFELSIADLHHLIASKATDVHTGNAHIARVLQMQSAIGDLNHHTYNSAPGQMSAGQRNALKAALNGFTGRAVAIAQRMPPGTLPVIHAINKADHHYFTLEKYNTTSGPRWIKRDSSTPQVTMICKKDAAGKRTEAPATTLFDAVEALFQNQHGFDQINESKDNNGQQQRVKPLPFEDRATHIFIPKGVR